MAVAQGYGKTVTSGSVFAYDTGDTRNSYIGEPTTNVFTHYGTEGQGSSADNAVNFSIQGTTGFVRLGYGQSFGDYTIKPGDVVYKYNLGANGCHYHGNSVSIPSGKYVTFTFDYYVSPGTTIENTLLANLENYGGSALGGNIFAPNNLTGVWQTVTTTFGPTGGSGTQAMFLYPGGCGPRFGDTGYILYKNPQVEFLPHKTPFVQTTRSATQGLLPLVGNSTIDLTNMSFDSNAQMTFDGTDDRIEFPAITLSGDFTISQVVTLQGTANGPMPIGGGFYGNGSTYLGYVWFRNTANEIRLAVNGELTVVFSVDPTLWVNKTILYTIKRSGSTATLYINGAEIASGTVSTNNFDIRTVGYSYSTAYASLGTIPVTRLYNRALSAEEVKQNFDFYDVRFGLDVDTYYFAVSNRAARYERFTGIGKNMATTTPAYILYQKPDASKGIVANYTEIARDDIGSPARITIFGSQLSYSNGRYLTSVTVRKSRKSGRLFFEFPDGGTSQYGEAFYRSIITPHVP